jgi:hypothetical protein
MEYRPEDSGLVETSDASKEKMSQNKLEKLSEVVEEGAFASVRQKLAMFGQWTKGGLAEAGQIMLGIVMYLVQFLVFILHLLRRANALNKRQKFKEAAERQQKVDAADTEGSAAGSPTL